MRSAATLFLLFLAATLAATTPASAATVREPYEDALSYEAALTSNAAGRTLAGTETITLRNDGAAPLSSIWLRLWGNAVKGCRPLAVSAAVTSGGRAGRLLRDCTALEVILPAPLRAGRTATLSLALRITAPSVRDRFGTAERINLFGNALPVVAQRDAGGWRLPTGSRYGESFVTTWARFSLQITHPSALQVAASGSTLTERLDDATSVTRSTVDARDTFWAIGPMAEATVTTRRGTKIRIWSTPEAGGDRNDVARDAVPALEDLERHLPPYPYPELDIVVARIAAGGGMEYPTLVLTDGSSDVTRHEIAHQWFYGLVGNDQYREPWIDEGFTSFLEYTWTGAKLAPPECYPASRLAIPSPTSWVTQSMRYWNAHPGRYWFVYQNPVCALREQQRLLGAAKFEQVIRRLVTSNARGVLTGSEVRLAFRRAGGRDADAIWRRWAMAPQPG